MQASAVRRRNFTCSECGKTFRSHDDMYLHAEVCLLDAFEMEANAIMENPSLANEPDDRRGTVHGANDFQGIFRPYVEPKREKERASVSVVSANRYFDEGGYTATATVQRRASASRLAAATEIFDDDDFDAPPQLELADPQLKKYKRIFPIGEDGKQIRPKMECPTCGLVLYRHNFSTHYRIHTGELPFQCSFCDKRFRTSSALTVHTRCHTGDKPYMCPHCEYSCITKRNLDRHIVNNHVKRSRQRHFLKTVGGSGIGFYRRRGRPSAQFASRYEEEELADEPEEDEEGLDDVVMQLGVQHDPENQPSSTRRGRRRKEVVADQEDDAMDEEVLDDNGATQETAENGGDDDIVTYHVTQEEMEQLIRAAEAEGVIIQHENVAEAGQMEGTAESGTPNQQGVEESQPVKNEKAP